MKCHSGKKIKGHVCQGDLQTKRTLTEADGTVRRERYCPVCQTQQWTVEQFESKIKANNSQHEEEMYDLKQQLRQTILELDEIKRIGNAFLSIFKK